MNAFKDLGTHYFKDKIKGHCVQKTTVEWKTAKVVMRRKIS